MHVFQTIKQVHYAIQRGLPRFRPSQGWYIGSFLINALGSGLFYPFAVLPNWQRLGIAGRLMQAIIARARQQRKLAILLLCKSHLIGFYEHLGFVNLGPSNSSHGGFQWYQMKFPLAPEETT